MFPSRALPVAISRAMFGDLVRTRSFRYLKPAAGPPRSLGDHADEAFGLFCRHRTTVARRSESEVGVRVGGPTSMIYDWRLEPWGGRCPW